MKPERRIITTTKTQKNIYTWMNSNQVIRYVHSPNKNHATRNNGILLIHGDFLHNAPADTSLDLEIRSQDNKTTIHSHQPTSWQYVHGQSYGNLEKNTLLPLKSEEQFVLYSTNQPTGELSVRVDPHDDDPPAICEIDQDIDDIIQDIETTYGPILLVEFGDRGKQQFRSPNKILTATGERIEHRMITYSGVDRAFVEACWDRSEHNRKTNVTQYCNEITNLTQIVNQQRKNKKNIERHGPF